MKKRISSSTSIDRNDLRQKLDNKYAEHVARRRVFISVGVVFLFALSLCFMSYGSRTLTGNFALTELDISYVGTNFSAPVDFFSTPQNQTIFNISNDKFPLNSQTQDVAITASVNIPGVIFKTGYFWSPVLNDWIPFEFAGSFIPGSSTWINGSASKTLTINASRYLGEGYNFITAYACKRYPSPNGPWKCGCDSPTDTNCAKWMLLVFNVTGVNTSAQQIYCTNSVQCNISRQEQCIDSRCIFVPQCSENLPCESGLVCKQGLCMQPGPLGSSDNPYVISSLNQLANISSNLSASYKLAADIDASETRNWNSGAGWTPIPSFSGTFEGDGHKISNLYMKVTSGAEGQGFFGTLESGGVVKNLRIENLNLTSTWVVGGIAGVNRGTIYRCSVTGSLNGTGLGNSLTGGLVGYNYGIIDQSYTSGNIYVASSFAGGLAAGNSQASSINNSYSMMTILGKGEDVDNVAGLIGYSSGTSKVANSYYAGFINNSLGSCSRWCSPTGGLNARDYGTSQMSNSYWDVNVSKQYSSVGGTGKSTSEMKQQSAYAGWDFTNIWAIDSAKNNGYPYLRWQNL